MFQPRGLWLAGLLALGFVLNQTQSTFGKGAIESNTPELRKLGDSVIKLLQTGKTKEFAAEVGPTVDDWLSIRGTNDPATEAIRKDVEQMLGYTTPQLIASAGVFLDRAAKVGLNPTNLQWTLINVETATVGTQNHPKFMAPGQELPWTSKITVTLAGDSKSKDAALAKYSGQYKVSFEQNSKFGTNWRSQDGLRWIEFPRDVVGEDMMLEMTILSVAEKHKPLTSQEDPALATLGRTMAKFLQSMDENVFATNALQDMETIWTKLSAKLETSSLPASERPSKKDFEENFVKFQEEHKKSAREVVQFLKEHDIDFTGAKVEFKEATIKSIYARGEKGSIEDLQGSKLLFVFAVSSEAKTKTGKPISGDYILRGKRASRSNNKWTMEDAIGWQMLPEGLVDKAVMEKMGLENHIAEQGTFPRGYQAPDIEITKLDDDTKVKLSDYRGQVVVIDFWATWCGPCQEPMAKLQKMVTDHPEWKDELQVLSLSIDTDLTKLRNHLTSKGWTNSVNTWAGKGGWEAAPAKAFRVRGVPTSYVIGKDGKVIWAGHPFGNAMEQAVASGTK